MKRSIVKHRNYSQGVGIESGFAITEDDMYDGIAVSATASVTVSADTGTESPDGASVGSGNLQAAIPSPP